MTITSAQSNIANLLRRVTIQGGTADVGRLSKQEASQLLNAMAKDSLTAGGTVKSGYFRVLTDKNGAITEIGRSSVSSKGRDAATSLIKALVARALGEDSPELTSLNSYLQRSGDKVGSKSLVKLIAAKSIENKNDGLASIKSFTLKEQFTAEQRTAFSNYMQRIGGNVRDDTTGRLRLPIENNARADLYVRGDAPPSNPGFIQRGDSQGAEPGSLETPPPNFTQSGNREDLWNQSWPGGAKSYVASGDSGAGTIDKNKVDPYETSTKTKQRAKPPPPKSDAKAPPGTPDFNGNVLLGDDT